MDILEQNKQIVQEALDERATKRKNVIIEAEQEAITTQMIDIVNKNASDAEKQRKAVELQRKKKISLLKRQANCAMLGVFASLLQLGVGISSYIVGATELWSAIVACILSATIFTIQIIILVNNSRKLDALM